MVNGVLQVIIVGGCLLLFTNAYAAQAVAAVPVWSVDPKSPGENLPPAGRSLFDFLVAQTTNGQAGYHIPYPFQALVQHIEAQLQFDDSGMPPLKRTLIPLGRSLQRNAASPDFFKFPRVVAAVDAEPSSAQKFPGIFLKDRLYLGYQEKANTIEVISYNEAAGRFEFQEVKDYRAGGEPKLFYANRTVCMSCHQNGAPIFAQPLWDETNANPKIAALLKAEKRDFYGVKLNGGVDLPYFIDNATDRANLFSTYQLLWRSGCVAKGDSTGGTRCRADALTLMLQYRLSGSRRINADSALFRDSLVPELTKNWLSRWPGGLAIPNPNLPNRDPLTTAGTIPAELEPLNLRSPLEVWSMPNVVIIARFIDGLGSFIPQTNIRELDTHLFENRTRAMSHIRYRGPCEFVRKNIRATAYRLDFQCREGAKAAQGVAMQGSMYITSGKIERGVLDRLAFDGDEMTDLEITAGKLMRQANQQFALLRLGRGGLHVRHVGGSAVKNITLRWHHSNAKKEFSGHVMAGEVDMTVADDFAPLRAAINELERSTRGGNSDALSSRSFRRAAIMPAVFAQLGIAAQPWCCLEAVSMQAPRLETEVPGTAE